jgi:hypothetical protein
VRSRGFSSMQANRSIERPNQRMEPMTRSTVTLLLQSSVLGALLVMAHPSRWGTRRASVLRGPDMNRL